MNRIRQIDTEPRSGHDKSFERPVWPGTLFCFVTRKCCATYCLVEGFTFETDKANPSNCYGGRRRKNNCRSIWWICYQFCVALFAGIPNVGQTEDTRFLTACWWIKVKILCHPQALCFFKIACYFYPKHLGIFPEEIFSQTKSGSHICISNTTK